jgi:hydrogenase maturation protease
MNVPAGTRRQVLILGLGNDILGDDAIGLRAADELKDRIGEKYDWQKCNLGGLDILDVIKGYNHVVMIDAIKTGSREPGTVFFLKPEDFVKTLHIANFHDINFLNALEIGNRLGMDLPERIDIIAIEIVEDKEFSTELTPALSTAFSGICDEIEKWMRSELIRR